MSTGSVWEVVLAAASERIIMDDRENSPATLLVEDDPFMRTMLAIALEEGGFRVVEAQNADAAMKILKQGEKINVVITDVKMPGSMDGVGLAGWMREEAPGVPVILVSGFSFETDLRAINPAIAIIVKKPCDPDEVVGWVASLVKTPDG